MGTSNVFNMEIILTVLEIVATVTGIGAVALQAKEKLMAWPLAILSVTCAAVIYFYNKLYSDFGLHIIYIFLNVYGWKVWSNRNNINKIAMTVKMTLKQLLFAVFTVGIGTMGLGYVMDLYTDADLAYFDAFTTTGSLLAQYLLARKFLENWWFWIVVDIVAIPVYLYKELYFFSFLFFVYLVICVWGYFSWRQNFNLSSPKSND
jgi:nicotinamide mononucleotide transporter